MPAPLRCILVHCREGGADVRRRNGSASGCVHRKSCTVRAAGPDPLARPDASSLSTSDGIGEVGHAFFSAAGHCSLSHGGIQAALRLWLLGPGDEEGSGQRWTDLQQSDGSAGPNHRVERSALG